MSQHPIGLTIAGKYQIKRLLGEGGMGAVYEGLHLEIGKRVAIKTITVQGNHSEELATRFKREARTASAVESENIVQVFDVGQDPQVGLYMVMEHLSGEDLCTRLRRAPPLDAMAALAIFGQTLHGLEKAHAAGIVHRDLKPANLFLVDRGARLPLVKILDFGISKVMRDGNAVSGNTGVSLVTRIGAVMGTTLYMSPEQAQGAAQVDQRTDIWAMGALLYEIFAGRTPYEQAPTYEAMIVKIVTTLPTPLLQLAPEVPPALAAVIHQALKHNVSERIPDCATFLRLLDGAVPGAVGEWIGRASVVGSNLGFTAGVGTGPMPLTPMRASFNSRASFPNQAPPPVALTTGAGGAMVSSAGTQTKSSRPPPSRRGNKPLPIIVMGVSLAIAAAAVTMTVMSGHDRGAPTAAAVAPLPQAASSPPPVVVQPVAPPVVAAPLPPIEPAPALPMPAQAAKAAHRDPPPPAKPVASVAASAAAPPAAPAPAPSATAARQFGGVELSNSL